MINDIHSDMYPIIIASLACKNFFIGFSLIGSEALDNLDVLGEEASDEGVSGSVGVHNLRLGQGRDRVFGHLPLADHHHGVLACIINDR